MGPISPFPSPLGSTTSRDESPGDPERRTSPPVMSRQNSGRRRGERRRIRAASGDGHQGHPGEQDRDTGPSGWRSLHDTDGAEAQDEADAVGSQLGRSAEGRAFARYRGPRSRCSTATRSWWTPHSRACSGPARARRWWRPRPRKDEPEHVRGAGHPQEYQGRQQRSAQIKSSRKAWLPRPSARRYRQLSCSSNPAASARARGSALTRRRADGRRRHAGRIAKPTTAAVPVRVATARRQSGEPCR